MADAVLDLSAKSQADIGLYTPRRTSTDSYAPQSCSPTINHPLADENEKHEVTSAIKPVAGPIPTSPHSPKAVFPSRHEMPVRPDSNGSIPTSLASNPDSGSEDKLDSSGSGSPKPGTAGGDRHLKMYTSDAMSMYATSPLLSPASMSPSLNGALGLSSLYDSASFPSFPITPLTSHLLQRKRRAESRSTSVTSNSSDQSSPDVADSKRLKTVPEDKKDTSYWERRRKNNEAAKRSRDSRRMKEEEIAMRAAFLEQENLKLRAQVAILKNETAKLHYMLYNRL